MELLNLISCFISVEDEAVFFLNPSVFTDGLPTIGHMDKLFPLFPVFNLFHNFHFDVGSLTLSSCTWLVNQLSLTKLQLLSLFL